MNRRGICLAGALMLALAATACAAPQQPAPQPAAQRPVAERPAAPAPQLTDEQKLIEGAKKEGEVVMWVNTWGPQKREVEKLFEAKYPFIKITIADLPTAENIVSRFTSEAKVGRNVVDMLYISRYLPDLRAEDLLAEHNWPGWPNQPGHKYWLNLVVSGHVAVYNTSLVSPAESPRNYDDMKNTKWRGKTMLTTSGTDAVFRYAYMWREGDKLNWDKAESFWREVVANTRPRVGRGMTGPMEMLAAGEFPLIPNLAIGPFLTFYFKGAPVAVVPLGQMPGNAFAVAIAKSAPHPNSARLWADFLTTTEAQLIVSETQGNPPLSPEAAKKSRLRQLLTQMGTEPLYIPDEFWTPENISRASKFWLDLLGVR